MVLVFDNILPRMFSSLATFDHKEDLWEIGQEHRWQRRQFSGRASSWRPLIAKIKVVIRRWPITLKRAVGMIRCPYSGFGGKSRCPHLTEMSRA